MPFYEEKPCVYIKSRWEDHRRRLYNQNMLAKVIEKGEEGMSDVQEMITMERPHPERRLRGVLEELSVGCNRFCSLLQKASGKDGNSAGRTKLDKERARTLLREVEIIGKEARR
ncbi:otoferlin-like [Branchiostoma floridae]|uniref:Otoferlin-like n=1 Tax=Branchiostoma floridae TaxID=7739 RepID=A0A9J7MEW7_BRAFL|nr:otoferlin-like [Branchiostoma floridae]